MNIEPKTPEELHFVEQSDGLKHALARIQSVSSYVGELRGKIGLYFGWIPNDFADSAAQDNAYTLLKNDPEVARCIHLHSCMAAGEKWRIKCEDERLKFVLEKLLLNIRDFLHARKSLIENGMLFGLGIQKKGYGKFKIAEYPGISWIGIG